MKSTPLPSSRTGSQVRASVLREILQRRDGQMTRQLLLHPGKHGLGMTHESLAADTTTTMVCGYCSTGCGLRIHLRDGEAVGLTPETNYPVNMGMACPKGWEALRVLESPDRATTPLIRRADGELHPATWEESLTRFTHEFKKIQQAYGNESVAVLSTGQIATEEMALLGALTKFGMGIKHLDSNTRQCMATAATAYKQSFGFDAPPYTYDDFEQSDCIVFIGANPCIAHPIMWERLLRNPNHPEVIVLDPRRTETAMAATQHLPLKPKSDLVLLYAITSEIISQGYVDYSFVQQHTNHFDELVRHVAHFTPESVAETSGISPDVIRHVAKTIGSARAASLWWTMGINQSYEGTRAAQAIINIALITGNIGRPGTGANSITGQCNAMGSRLWGNATNLFGHHQFESEDDRRKIADLFGIEPARIPTEPSWPYDRIIEGIRSGEVRGLWVIATNPSHSWIDHQETRELLGKLDFLVVQDMYTSTETARQAHMVLPAAGWGEKEGTLINSERRYSVLKRLRRAPGQALADFQIFRAIAEYWGLGEMFSSWDSPEAVFRIMQQASRGQFCDITGIDGYGQLDRCGGIQWPWSEADAQAASGCDPQQQRRLFSDGYFPTSNGRANLMVDSPTRVPEPACADYPFVLLTGRGTVSQWHTQTRTSKSAVLNKLYPSEAYIEIHPQDAMDLGIQHNEHVLVQSRRGSMTARACLTPTVSRGQVFLPMHYDTVNRLTLSHFDPHSRQPSYKDCAVRVERATRTHSRSK